MSDKWSRLHIIGLHVQFECIRLNKEVATLSPVLVIYVSNAATPRLYTYTLKHTHSFIFVSYNFLQDMFDNWRVNDFLLNFCT